MRYLMFMSMIAALLLIAADPPGDVPQSTGEATKTIVAYVVADFDVDSNLVAVTLEEEAGEIYYVNLDQKGRELGNAYDGEWVEVEGHVMDMDDELWMTVKSISRYFRDDEEEGLFEDETEDWYDPNEPADDENQETEGEEEDMENEIEEGDWDRSGEPIEPEKAWPDEADDEALFDETDFH